ncbi:MAG TPA: hypothetical protein VFI31_00545 [Pirellulales bacterium]|nr:hypothetical protein [Pirellulales bacterium]
MSILDRSLPGTTRDPLYPDTDGFTMVETATGKRLPTEEEYAEEIEEATRRAEVALREADQAKREAEAGRQRVAELEAELARLRASLPPRDREH